MTPEAFGRGLAVLATTFGAQLSEAQVRIYRQALADLPEEDFERACAILVRTWRRTREEWFPWPSTIRRAAAPHTDLQAEAVRAFELVAHSSTYTPQGPQWSAARIGDLAGGAALEAYWAAGGADAFTTQQSEGKREWLRKRFTEAYVAAREAERSGRSLALSQPVRRELLDPRAAALVDTVTAHRGLPKGDQ